MSASRHHHPVVTLATLLFVSLALLVPGHVRCACIDGCACRADASPTPEPPKSCCAERAAAACKVTDEAAPDVPHLSAACCGKAFVTTDLAVAALPDAPTPKSVSAGDIAVTVEPDRHVSVGDRVLLAPRAPPDRASRPSTLLYGVWRL